MFYHALTGNGGTTPTEDLEPVLLWENPNVTSSFAAQTISLDLSEYAGVIIDFNQGHISNNMHLGSRSYLKKTDIFSNGIGVGWVGSSGTAYARNVVKVDDTGVQFSQGSNIEYNIPIAIYGVKNYIVEPTVGDLLWHNDNPTASQAGFTITGDYSKYSKILVKGRISTTDAHEISCEVPKNSDYSVDFNGVTSTTHYYRIAKFLDDSTISFANAATINTSQTITVSNTAAIVTEIYGIE